METIYNNNGKSAMEMIINYVAQTCQHAPQHGPIATLTMRAFRRFATPSWISTQPSHTTGKAWISAAIKDGMKISAKPRGVSA